MAVRGVRGATTVTENDRDAILTATTELLEQIVAANEIDIADIASVMFTTTTDLNAEFPAVAARLMGWNDVALIHTHEIPVPGSLPMCIRVLMHWNTEKPASEIRHVYLRGAKNLRSTPAPFNRR